MTDYAARMELADLPGLVAHARERMLNIPEADRELIAERGEPALLERIGLVLDRLLVVTSAVAPELVSARYVDAVKEKLEAVVEHLGGMTPNPHPTDITSLVEAVDDLAHDLLTWPTTGTEERMTQAASKYSRSLGQQISGIRADMEALAAEARTAREEIAEARAADDQARREHAANADETLGELTRKATAIETRVEALATQADQALARTDAAIARFEAQFSESQAARQAEAQAQDKAASRQIEEILARFTAEAEEGIADIAAQEKKAGELVSVFAAAGTANAFGKEAKDQATVANNWRLAAVVLAVFAVIGSVALLFAPGDADDAASIARGVAAVVALGAVAAYAAKQSATHRRREEQARERELDLVTFGPFIRELDEDKQAEARMQLIGRIFGRSGMAPDQGEPTLSDDQINLLGKVVDLVLRKRS